MASTIKVDTVQNQPGTNIINKCGTTVTLGASGDTVSLASGASQTGFGRTGTVDWETTPKTGDFTGANGKGYFINTTSGVITMTLPSASAGDIISIQDYNNTFDTYSFTIQAGSGVKINGGTAAGKLVLSTEGQGLTLIYVDSTIGWRSIESTTFSTTSTIPAYITATGGTITTVCTDYKVHTFTGPGTFTVCSVGNAAGSNTVSYVVVAGGGGGGFANTPPGNYSSGGGGGAGGYRESKADSDSYTASPLNATSGSFYNLPVSAQGYPITIGAGGGASPGSQVVANPGSNSIFSTVTAAGGGGGTAFCAPSGGANGGSGGGGGYGSANSCGGNGNTPPVVPAQGQPGGNGNGPGCYPSKGAHGGGGGGATAAGANTVKVKGGDGGAGATSSINATPTARAGGGGGGVYKCSGCQGANGSGAGGTGGGGPGGPAAGSTATGNGQNGTANTGGGAGGGSTGNNGGSGPSTGGTGGSGIVIIRYKFQN